MSEIDDPAAMAMPGPLYRWMGELTAANIWFLLSPPVRENAVLLILAVPGERWEVEFFEDGTVKVERFISTGSIQDGEPSLKHLLERHGS